MKILQVLLSYLGYDSSLINPQHYENLASKSIAIIGAGSGGLEVLKNLLDLPTSVREGWNIELFEQREDIGGIWLPQDVLPPPPTHPYTGLYPNLRTNTPLHTMTYPKTPFPPSTNLFPHHPHILAYLRNYASTHSLLPHINLNHTVLQTSWVGSPTKGHWSIKIQRRNGIQSDTAVKRFDHLILATGHHRVPHFPSWNGTDDWLNASDSKETPREILHAQWYRGPERYANRTVLVLGAGPSGSDGVTQILPFAKKVYHSVSDNVDLGDTKAIRKTRISYFTKDAIVFQDGSIVRDVDSVYLGTGYEIQFPFLEEGGLLRVDRQGRQAAPSYNGLLNTGFYLAPLYKHTLSLSDAFPPSALFVIGLPVSVSYRFSDSAQSIFTAHVIANNSLLPPRSELLANLKSQEAELLQHGVDLERFGHRQTVWSGQSEDYQDSFVEWLRERGALPPGPKFVEPWRRYARTNGFVLKRAWARIEHEGEEEVERWLRGVQGEEGYAELSERLVEWETRIEEEEGGETGLPSYLRNVFPSQA